MYKIDQITRNNFININMKTILTKEICQKKDIEWAIEKVYKSREIIARRMAGRGLINRMVIDTVLPKISNRINQIFNDPPNTRLSKQNYDKFFYDLCNCFKNEYNNLAHSQKGVSEIKFGIAQKLINMVFKYLSCFKDYDNYSDLFKFCHMPIDSYILRYFDYHRIVKNLKTSVSNNYPLSKYIVSSNELVSWSNMDEKPYNDLYKEYSTKLRANGFKNYSLLHLEYIIWSETKNNPKKPDSLVNLIKRMNNSQKLQNLPEIKNSFKA